MSFFFSVFFSSSFFLPRFVYYSHRSYFRLLLFCLVCNTFRHFSGDIAADLCFSLSSALLRLIFRLSDYCCHRRQRHRCRRRFIAVLLLPIYIYIFFSLLSFCLWFSLGTNSNFKWCLILTFFKITFDGVQK